MWNNRNIGSGKDRLETKEEKKNPRGKRESKDCFGQEFAIQRRKNGKRVIENVRMRKEVTGVKKASHWGTAH